MPHPWLSKTKFSKTLRMGKNIANLLYVSPMRPRISKIFTHGAANHLSRHTINHMRCESIGVRRNWCFLRTSRESKRGHRDLVGADEQSATIANACQHRIQAAQGLRRHLMQHAVKSAHAGAESIMHHRPGFLFLRECERMTSQ